MNKYSPYPGDKVPAVLEEGEYVLNRNAVNAIGKDKLDRVNHEKHPRYMNEGGGVEPPMVSIPPNMNMAQALQQKAFVLQNKYRHLVTPPAVKKEINDLLSQSRAMYPTPKQPSMASFHQKIERSRESTERKNQAVMDQKLLAEGQLRNEIDQALNLSRGEQTYDLARSKLRDITASNANTVSIFDDMFKDTVGTYADFMKESVAPRAPGQFDPVAMKQAEMLAQDMTSMDLKYTDNVLLREAISNDPRLSRIIERNDKRAEYAADKETQHIKDVEASNQRSKEWAEAQELKMSKAPKLKYNFAGGMKEEDVTKKIKQAVEDNDFSVLQAMAQGFQGSDDIDNGYGLYSLLNMNVLAKQAGVPEEELKTIASMGDQARVDKANRNSVQRVVNLAEEKKPSKLKQWFGNVGKGLTTKKSDRLLAQANKGKWNNQSAIYEDVAPPKAKKEKFKKAGVIDPVTGTDRNAPTRVTVGPNLPGALDPLQFSDQKADTMKRAGMKLPPTLMQEGGEAKKPGFLSRFAQGAKDWATQDWGKRYDMDAIGEENINTLKAQESRGTLEQMEGWDQIPDEDVVDAKGNVTQKGKSSLIAQRAAGLASNDMYGETDDNWETDDEDKINPANETALKTLNTKQIAGRALTDVAKGVGYTAAGAAAIAPAGIAGGLYGLYKGNELMKEGKTDYDTFQKTGKGSGWQKVGGMLAEAGKIGRAMNEDSPFASMMGGVSGPQRKQPTSTAKFGKDAEKGALPGYEAETPQAAANSVKDSKEALNKITDPLNQDLSDKPGSGVLKQENAPVWDEKNADMVMERQRMLKKAGIDIGTSGSGGDGVDGNWGPKSQAAWDELNAMKESGYMTEDADGKQVYQFGHDYEPPVDNSVNSIVDPMTGGIHTKQNGGFISGIMRYQNGGRV